MYSISLQQIEYFLTVAERGSVSEAARVLFVAQPTVTKWIHCLEKELDTRLFTRRIGGMELTKDGRFLYEKWRKIIDDLCLSIEELHTMYSGLSDNLRIGCLAGFNYDRILPRAIERFHATYPNVYVSVHSCGFRELREKLQNNELDCIITMTFDLDNVSGLSQRIVEELHLYIVISKAHKLAQREVLNLSDVRDEVFYILSPKESSRGGEQIIKACQRVGFTPGEIRYVPNLPSMAMAIKQGDGVTIASDEIQRGSEDLIRLYRTEDLPLDCYITIAWRSKGASSATLRFIEMLRFTGK